MQFTVQPALQGSHPFHVLISVILVRCHVLRHRIVVLVPDRLERVPLEPAHLDMIPAVWLRLACFNLDLGHNVLRHVPVESNHAKTPPTLHGPPHEQPVARLEDIQRHRLERQDCRHDEER